MTPFLETGGMVRALDTLEVMAVKRSVTLKHVILTQIIIFIK